VSLNEAQEQAVEGCGVQLILAGPGSGKTLVITEKILHLLANGVKPENILALTFSKKAAQEMVERLEKSIDPSDITIGTFHSFCFGVLQDNVLDSGISFSSGQIDRTNQLVWALRNIDSFGFEHLKVGNNAAKLVESIIDGISTFKDELIMVKELETYLKEKDAQQLSEEERNYLNKLSDLLKVYQAYEPYKRKDQLLDFDDQIVEASRLFGENPLLLKRYRQRYAHILVDEFQDTNFAQLSIIKQLAGENVCVVGDDDQAIYRFRGAYLTNFKDFSDHFGTKELLLDVNYRNSRNILTLAMQLMQNALYRKEKALVTNNPDESLITVATCENEQAEAAYVLNEIQKCIKTEFSRRSSGEKIPISYKDIAVLSRQRAAGVKIHDILQKNGIPAEFVGEVDFFASPVIRDLIAYLRVIDDPLRAGVPLTRVMKSLGITEANISHLNSHAKREKQIEHVTDGVFYAMLEAKGFLPTQNVEIAEIALLIEELLNRKERISLTALVYELLTHYSGLYKNNIDGGNIRNVTLLNRFYQLVQEYSSLTREASVEDLLSYLDLLSGFELEIADYEETDSVKVMTVHQSKGKEFPVVFAIDLAANKFPSKHRPKQFYVPSDLSRGLKIEEDERALYVQEERRLLYVAMTRAEHKLYLTYAEQYGNNKNKSKPSPFLLELDYENNPLVERLYVEQEEAAHILSEESPVEKAKRKLQEQAAQAIYQMRTKTALQHVMDLEKIRLLEAGLDLDAFNVEQLLEANVSDGWLEDLLQAESAPLISDTHRFSASALNTYDNCPLHYKFTYVLNVPSASKMSFNLGSLIHKVIHQLTLRELEGIPPTEGMALELLERLWPSAGFSSKQEEGEKRVEAEQLLSTYIEWNLENENEVVGAEVEFLFPLIGRNVKGFIDRLERTSDGQYVVVDFKTGSSMESKKKLPDNIQMNVYCLAVQNKFGQIPVRCSLMYLKKRRMVDFKPDAQNLEKQKARLEGIIEQVICESFDSQPSYDACLFCGYGELCETKEVEE
jgi:DNA helicase II / ATP-dependent DNA helicase PcrA